MVRRTYEARPPVYVCQGSALTLRSLQEKISKSSKPDGDGSVGCQICLEESLVLLIATARHPPGDMPTRTSQCSPEQRRSSCGKQRPAISVRVASIGMATSFDLTAWQSPLSPPPAVYGYEDSNSRPPAWTAFVKIQIDSAGDILASHRRSH